MGASLKPGDIIADKFRVERELGQGGMASVFEATHLDLGERVAVKVLKGEVAHIESVVARFSREAKAMSRVKSEHVVRVLDVGKLPTGEPYMVMEHLEGADLGDVLSTHGPFAPSDAVDLVLQICEAIAEAHARGIIHRDLKPSNLFMTTRPDGSVSVKVLDFGISKVADAAGAPGSLSLTRTSALLGSPLYMAPEQIASARDADERADIWGLGVVLYELLAAVPPFHATSLQYLQYKILNEVPASLCAQRPQVPAGLDAVVLRCLEKQPERRFAHAGDLARALGPFASERGQPYVSRVCGVISRAQSLAVSTGQRTARMKVIDAASVTPPSEIGLDPTFDISGSGSVEESAPMEGTRGAWGGSQKTGAVRSRVGLVVTALLGTVAAVILVVAAVRHVSGTRAVAEQPEGNAVVASLPESTANAPVVLPAAVTAPSASSSAVDTEPVRPKAPPARTSRPKSSATADSTPASTKGQGGLFETRK